MKITGELLKSERKKLKLSQQDIAFALKLSTRVINAIEEGDVDNLPAKTFVRGFIKSYAEMLKLDSTMVLNQYHEEMGTTQLSSKLTAVPQESSRKSSHHDESPLAKPKDISTVTPNLKVSLNRGTFKIVALITLAVVILGGINEVINKYQKEGLEQEAPHLSVETISQEANASKELGQPSGTEVAPEVDADSVATTEPVAPPVTVQSTAATSVEKPVEKPTTERPAEKPSETVAAAPTPPAAVPAAAKPRATIGKPIEIVIEATRDTVISYATGTDNQFKTLNLKKDTLQIIKSKNGLHVKINEGDAVLVTVNGIHRGQASSDTKPVEFSY